MVKKIFVELSRLVRQDATVCVAVPDDFEEGDLDIADLHVRFNDQGRAWNDDYESEASDEQGHISSTVPTDADTVDIWLADDEEEDEENSDLDEEPEAASSAKQAPTAFAYFRTAGPFSTTEAAWFCSEACRDATPIPAGHVAGTGNDYPADAACDKCLKPLNLRDPGESDPVEFCVVGYDGKQYMAGECTVWLGGTPIPAVIVYAGEEKHVTLRDAAIAWLEARGLPGLIARRLVDGGEEFERVTIRIKGPK